MSKSSFLQGVKAALPIVLGYFPVAMAFGLSGSSLHLDPFLIIAISLFVYAGAAQFFILSALKIGTPLVLVVALCTLLNARHLFYGPIISRYLPPNLKARLLKAFFLTDEVFATAFSQMKLLPKACNTQAWYFGLGITAWLSWVGGTVVGVFVSDGLLKTYPLLDQWMRFALPALFFVLAVQCINRTNAFAALGAGLSASVITLLGYPTVAIMAGAVVGFVLYKPVKDAHE